MVATTFAADTPLAVTGIVARDGVAGNWIWWNGALGSMLSVLFFARLWRRAGILTDVAFVEIRYHGRAARLLRGFRALYLGLPVNCMIIGWVNLAMAKILEVTLGWTRLTAVFAGLALTGAYVTVSGLRGVVLTDLIQFALAMTGALAVAYFALRAPEVGGLPGLGEQLPETTFLMLPAAGASASGAASTLSLSAAAFVAYLGVQWWASWYPGQEPGGGGYLAQRMMAARDERQATLATLWFTVAHYCVRPWPWVLAALAALILYPDVADREAGYALIVRDHLPAGWRGLVLGSLAAAFMSTMSTQLNWGASYLVHDVYARFVRPEADNAHYVRAARIATLCIMVLSAGVTLYLDSSPAGVGADSPGRGGHRAGADSAVVLVAHQRVVGDRGDGRPPRRSPRAGPVHRRRLPRVPAVSRGVDDGLLARGHVAHPARAGGDAGRVLPAGAPRRPGVGEAGRPHRRAAAGVDPGPGGRLARGAGTRLRRPPGGGRAGAAGRGGGMAVPGHGGDERRHPLPAHRRARMVGRRPLIALARHAPSLGVPPTMGRRYDPPSRRRWGMTRGSVSRLLTCRDAS